MAARLEGKRVVVTGGSEGIGRAIVERLCALGARVVTCARDEKKLARTVQELQSQGADIAGVPADVSREEDVTRLFKIADAALGRLDVFVGNAAVGAPAREELQASEAGEVLDINLKGQVLCTRLALQRLGEGGRIVFIGSMSADGRDVGESVYAGSKAGLQGFAEALRKEVHDQGVHVSLIEPGAVNTAMQEMSEEEKAEKVAKHEMMTPEDIADCVEFVLTRPARSDVVSLQVRPHHQAI